MPLSRQSPPEHILKTPRAQPPGGLYFIVTHSQDLNYFFKNFKSRLNCVAIEAPMALDAILRKLKKLFQAQHFAAKREQHIGNTYLGKCL